MGTGVVQNEGHNKSLEMGYSVPGIDMLGLRSLGANTIELDNTIEDYSIQENKSKISTGIDEKFH